MTKKIEYYWDKWNNTPLGLYLTQKEQGFIQRSIRNRDSIKHILDVGGGSGRFAIPLYQKGMEVFVLENDIIPLLKLKEKCPEIITILGKGQIMPFRASLFDVVIAIEVFGYFKTKTERLLVLKEFKRVMKEGALVLFTINNKNSYKNFFKRCTNFRPPIKSGYVQSYRQMIQELRDTGFTVLKVFGFNWLPFIRNLTAGKSLVNIFSLLEDCLHLKKLPSISPWDFFIAKKT